MESKPTLPESVDEQLKKIAETGVVDIDWTTLQLALKDRLIEVIDGYKAKNNSCVEDQYQEPNVEKFNLDNSRDEILELIASFNEAPFTIQRICELLYSPFKYYDKTCTFLRGLEKNWRVISSYDWPKNYNNESAGDVDNNCLMNQQTQQSQHEDMNQSEEQPPDTNVDLTSSPMSSTPSSSIRAQETPATTPPP